MPAPEGFKVVWVLKKLDPHGPVVHYSVAQPKGEPAGCTCPDHEQRGSTCKHIMALPALGLLPRPKTARPPKARTRQIHARNARQAIAEAKALPVEARRHLAEIATALPEGWQPGGADPSFATGFRSAVAAHVGQLRGTGRPGSHLPHLHRLRRGVRAHGLRRLLRGLLAGRGCLVSNSELLTYVQAEIQRMEALPGPCARFVRSQLERTEQLLRLTGASSPAEFDARIECNEEWVKEEAFGRGYAEGRASLQHLLSFCAADHLN